MWESLAKILTSGNAVPIIGIIAFIIVLIIIGIKKGIISFSGHGLSINDREQEREKEAKIRRQQSEYLNMIADSTINDLPKHLTEGNSYYRCKYVISKFKDLFEQAIMYNHISDDDEYVQLKQELAYFTIMKVTEDQFFKTDSFKKYLDELVAKIIKRFVKIRKTYS